MLAERLRNWIACYAAAITIILQQLNVQSLPEPVESPNPLVRIQPSLSNQDGWHPDELVTNRAGRKSVVVWESGVDGRDELVPARILSN